MPLLVQNSIYNEAVFAPAQPTMLAPSTAGNLLVCFVMLVNTISGNEMFGRLSDAGWVRRTHNYQGSGSDGVTGEIWEYPNNPGGITTVNIDSADSFVTAIGLLAEFAVTIADPFDGSGIGGPGFLADVTASVSPDPSFSTDLAVALDADWNASGVNPDVPTGWTDLGSNPDPSGTHNGFRAVYLEDAGTPLSVTFHEGQSAPNQAVSIVAYKTTLAAPQVLRPDADLAAGGWAPTPLTSHVSEGTADGDVISATAS